jgi:aminoglycoside 6-adenylyltransferase
MRSEAQMIDLIVGTAKDDERIRAVIMGGSRANPNAPRDPFQDFDIIYLVTDVGPFRCNTEWIERFGEIMVMQMPEDMQDPPPAGDGTFVYLVQFADGNRIDLRIHPLARYDELRKDSLSIVLLDKDGHIERLPLPDESSYLPEPPTAKAFSDCCNEFWWVCPYVAKGLWREEILYAKHCLDHSVRDQLIKMITWYVGVRTEFSRNLGQHGKYLKQYLEPELWQMLQQTYSDAGYENTWEALYTTCDLFRRVAIQVAERFGFGYPHEDDGRVSAHLRHVRYLPRDAKDVYE